MTYNVEFPGHTISLHSDDPADLLKLAQIMAIAPQVVSVLSPVGVRYSVKAAFSQPWFK